MTYDAPTKTVALDTNSSLEVVAGKLGITPIVGGYANLAALPSAATNRSRIVKTTDGGVYASDGTAWLELRAPTSTYAPATGIAESAVTGLVADLAARALKGRVFDIRDYGAVADCPLTGSTAGATDNIAALYAAAVACYNGGGGIVYCPTPTNGKCYGLFGALSSNTAVNAAQILLPYAAQSTGPIVIRLMGDTSFGSFPSTPAGGFAQAPNSQGTIFRTTATANSGGWGAIIDVGNNNSGFSNIHLIVDRVNFRLPDDPGVSAIRGVWFSALEVDDCMVDTPSATGSIVQPTNTKQAGIYFPQNNLQGPASAHRLAVIGCYAGFYHSEHFSGDEIEIFACAIGYKIGLGYHAANIGRLGIWWCPTVMQVDTAWNGSTAPGPVPLNIGLLDIEIPPASGTYSGMWWALSKVIDDTNNGLIFGRPVPYNYIQAMTGLLTSPPPVTGAAKANLTPARPSAPRVATERVTSGNLSLTSTTWAVVAIPALSVQANPGDILEINLNARPDVASVDTAFDVVTQPNNVNTNYVSSGTGTPATDGISGWYVQGQTYTGIYWGRSMRVTYVVQAADIFNGAVKVIPAYKMVNAGTRTFNCSAGDPVNFSVKNLGNGY